MRPDVLTAGEEPPHTIQPLTRRHRESGEVYQRDAEIERQIAAALRLRPATLLARAKVSGYQTEGYIPEEALVYLIRDYLKRGDSDTAGALCEVLSRRCVSFVTKFLGRFEAGVIEEAHDQVMTQVWGQIFDLESDRGDFFQARFWLTLWPLLNKAYTRLKAELQRSRPLYVSDDDTAIVRSAGQGDGLPSVAVVERDIEIEEILAPLPEPLRTAFIMRRVLGFPIESNEADVPTISGYFGKTPRTIRNWFIEIDRITQTLRDRHEER